MHCLYQLCFFTGRRKTWVTLENSETKSELQECPIRFHFTLPNYKMATVLLYKAILTALFSSVVYFLHTWQPSKPNFHSCQICFTLGLLQWIFNTKYLLSIYGRCFLLYLPGSTYFQSGLQGMAVTSKESARSHSCQTYSSCEAFDDTPHHGKSALGS